MAIEYLKRGKPEAERSEDDAKVRSIVEGTLKEIETAVMRRFGTCQRSSTNIPRRLSV